MPRSITNVGGVNRQTLTAKKLLNLPVVEKLLDHGWYTGGERGHVPNPMEPQQMSMWYPVDAENRGRGCAPRSGWANAL